MVRLGGIKRYSSIKYLVVDEADACLLNNGGNIKSSLLSLSSSTLHELLSKYLSPTYDDGSSSTVRSDKNGRSGIDLESIEAATAPNNHNKARPISHARQTIFCSATIPQHRHFMKQCVQNRWILSNTPRHVCLRQGEQLIPPSLDHAYMVCFSSENKLAVLRRILQKIHASNNDQATTNSKGCKKVLVFAEPHRPLEEMAQLIAKDLDGLAWNEIHGPDDEANASAIVSVLRFEDSLSQRAAAIQGFSGETNAPVRSYEWQFHGNQRSNNDSTSSDKVKFRVLLSSDLAARGLDIASITHVIQMDLAPDADTYVHRSGRTGRFGAPGQVVSIITPEQEFVLNRLANKLFLEMNCIARQKRKSKGKHKS